MKLKTIGVLLIACAPLLFGLRTASANFVNWEFEIFNDPNARQVALNVAGQQRSLEEGELTPEEEFRNQLERRILSRIMQAVVAEAFGDGEGDFNGGQFQTGDLEIDIIADNGETITIHIHNKATGADTIIEVPYYDFEGFQF